MSTSAAQNAGLYLAFGDQDAARLFAQLAISVSTLLKNSRKRTVLTLQPYRMSTAWDFVFSAP